jgi:transposase
MKDLFTLKQFVEEQQLFSMGSIRNMIHKRNENGLENSGAVVRYGRKILINKEKFFQWLQNQEKFKK